jgi:hypothetical protein
MVDRWEAMGTVGISVVEGEDVLVKEVAEGEYPI